MERGQQAEPTAAKIALKGPQPGEHEARDTPKQLRALKASLASW